MDSDRRISGSIYYRTKEKAYEKVYARVYLDDNLKEESFVYLGKVMVLDNTLKEFKGEYNWEIRNQLERFLGHSDFNWGRRGKSEPGSGYLSVSIGGSDIILRSIKEKEEKLGRELSIEEKHVLARKYCVQNRFAYYN